VLAPATELLIEIQQVSLRDFPCKREKCPLKLGIASIIQTQMESSWEEMGASHQLRSPESHGKSYI
jgi:hypothetical protein